MVHQDFERESATTGRSGLLSGLVKMNRYLLVLLIIPAGAIYFWPSFKDKEEALRKLDVLSAQRDELKQEAALMEEQLELIQKDPDYFEARVRDKMNLQKDGEMIVRFRDQIEENNPIENHGEDGSAK